jgi:DNA-binding LytR/AlgR family response regulator
MSAVTALIAEDEAPQRTELRRLLSERWPELQIVAECEDGLIALEALHSFRPQLAFLDIRLPGLSGLEIARAAQGIAHVIFTTAYDEYAVQAFDRGAIDYLLKPIKAERLSNAIQRVRERFAANEPQELLDIVAALQAQLATKSQEGHIKWITATLGNTTKLFAIEDVLYFRAQDKYTHVVTCGDAAQIRMPLKALVEKLDPEVFWQVHRSIIVRASAIRSLQRGEDGKHTLRLKNAATELPVSSAFQYRFRGM